MTIMETLQRIDEVKPNGYSQLEKIKWLSSLDGTVKREIIDTHEVGHHNNDHSCPCEKAIVFNGYTEDDLTKELLIPAPYDDIYIRYLEMQIDYANGEYGKYNNSMEVYNTAYNSYANYYNRNHMPIGKKFKFF